jgi:hypothetical protein
MPVAYKARQPPRRICFIAPAMLIFRIDSDRLPARSSEPLERVS